MERMVEEIVFECGMGVCYLRKFDFHSYACPARTPRGTNRHQAAASLLSSAIKPANLVLGTTKCQELTCYVTKPEHTTHSHPFKTSIPDHFSGYLGVIGNRLKHRLRGFVVTKSEQRGMPLLQGGGWPGLPTANRAVGAPSFAAFREGWAAGC